AADVQDAGEEGRGARHRGQPPGRLDRAQGAQVDGITLLAESAEQYLDPLTVRGAFGCGRQPARALAQDAHDRRVQVRWRVGGGGWSGFVRRLLVHPRLRAQEAAERRKASSCRSTAWRS